MVLVDTSIWLQIERQQFDLEAVVPLHEVVICPPVAQEILQGAQSQSAYSIAFATVMSVPMIEDPMPFETFEEAAQIYRLCRMEGYTIRSPLDCLIASCAIRNSIPLLQRDRDFLAIAKVAPLRLFTPSPA